MFVDCGTKVVVTIPELVPNVKAACTVLGYINMKVLDPRIEPFMPCGILVSIKFREDCFKGKTIVEQRSWTL